ncbi:MAG: two-component histidine kinase [Candidatus Eremiobacteraeota bacterium]|jgi:two-component system OmpR family sensor kinase|nr:two-component histidine kinase [Candidatus Eremiobacteraeota bacterium]
MDRRPSRSFAARLVFTYVGAVFGLLFLIGSASTLFTFALYARTTNEVITAAVRTIELRIASHGDQRVPLARLAPSLTAELFRPRIRVAVYDERHRLLSESAPLRATTGVVGAVASLMDLHEAQIPVSTGFVLVTADMGQLQNTLQEYWTLMLPLGVLGIALAWGAGWLITRQAMLPLTQISAAMRRFARGDFRPEPIRSTSDDEIGELAHSYNGALHQVRIAIAERDRSEAEIRQFIADAGHELRTPLTVIMGYLDVLEDGAFDAPGIRERVFTTLRQESRRMRLLIERLIYLARLERGEANVREIVDISVVVSRIATSLAPAEEAERVEISTVPDARVVADEGEIVEAVRNLVDNALKYAPGSKVTVSTAVQGDEVLLVVGDHGPGMSEQDQAHAFDRFYRGHGNGDVEGTGLGLAIVKRAVHRAEGTIAVESRPGEGTQFTIHLPHATGNRRPMLRRAGDS